MLLGPADAATSVPFLAVPAAILTPKVPSPLISLKVTVGVVLLPSVTVTVAVAEVPPLFRVIDDEVKLTSAALA